MENLDHHTQGKQRRVRRPKFLAGIPARVGRSPDFLVRSLVPDDVPVPAHGFEDTPGSTVEALDVTIPEMSHPLAPGPDAVPAPASGGPAPEAMAPEAETPAPPADAAPTTTTAPGGEDVAPVPPPMVKTGDGPSPAEFATTARDASGLPEYAEPLRAGLMLLHRTGEKLAEQARSDALEIGLEVARHILGQELRANVEPVLRLVREAIRHAGSTRQVTVRLCPHHAAQVQGVLDDGSGQTLSVAEVTVVADPELSIGDVEVETEFGYVDGRLNRRFDDLRQKLQSTLRRGEAS